MFPFRCSYLDSGYRSCRSDVNFFGGLVFIQIQKKTVRPSSDIKFSFVISDTVNRFTNLEVFWLITASFTAQELFLFFLSWRGFCWYNFFLYFKGQLSGISLIDILWQWRTLGCVQN